MTLGLNTLIMLQPCNLKNIPAAPEQWLSRNIRLVVDKCLSEVLYAVIMVDAPKGTLTLKHKLGLSSSQRHLIADNKINTPNTHQ